MKKITISLSSFASKAVDVFKLLYPLIIVITIWFFIIFVGSKSSYNPKSLPTNATDIVDMGNGWATFRINDKKFLYYKDGIWYSEYACITQIK